VKRWSAWEIRKVSIHGHCSVARTTRAYIIQFSWGEEGTGGINPFISNNQQHRQTEQDRERQCVRTVTFVLLYNQWRHTICSWASSRRRQHREWVLTVEPEELKWRLPSTALQNKTPAASATCTILPQKHIRFMVVVNVMVVVKHNCAVDQPATEWAETDWNETQRLATTERLQATHEPKQPEEDPDIAEKTASGDWKSWLLSFNANEHYELYKSEKEKWLAEKKWQGQQWGGLRLHRPLCFQSATDDNRMFPAHNNAWNMTEFSLYHRPSPPLWTLLCSHTAICRYSLPL